ncbi:MAG: DUF1861 family protein [Pleomorphochaeta sp.]
MNKKYTVEELLKEYRNSNNFPIFENKMIKFDKVNNNDVYNPSYPIKINNKLILPARVEKRDSEHSKVIFFKETNQALTWEPDENFKTLELQDPFWIEDNDTLLIGGVQVDFAVDDTVINWKTVCYKLMKNNTFSHFFTGPNKMKDIRFCKLKNGKIALFTRPQGTKESKLGQIGFTILSSWENLSTEVIEKAPLLNIFDENQWGGINHAQLLPDGNIGLLGHIACYSTDKAKHYYPISFVLNPDTTEIIKEPKIILERNQLLKSPSKSADLEDIIFPGGAIQEDGGTTLYLGISDASVQIVKTKNIFNI